MADELYVQFNTELNVGSAEHAQAALTLYEEFEREDFCFRCEADGDRLWLYDADGNANIERVVKFVCKLAQQFQLKGKWGFAWADTLPSPAFNPAYFGGGAVAIDLATGDVEFINTGNWLEDHTKSGSRVREGTAPSLAAFL
jgi:hypothetical protein